MMRLRFWRRHPEHDALDPELQSIFAASARPPILDAARLDRGRMKVAAQLRAEPTSGGWFGRRLAYGVAGGGSMWGAVLGTALVNKAATAVGLGVLLATGATAELTGIGPAVREAVSPAHSSQELDGENILASATATASATAAATTTSNEPRGNGGGAVVIEAPEDVPGNLTAHLRPNGTFALRGVLVSVDGDLIDVQTSLDDVPLQFNLGAALIRLPGPAVPSGGPNAGADVPTLEDFEEHLVLITGSCETIGDELSEDCELTVVSVLGNAGRGGPPDDPGNGNGPPDDNPGNGPPEGAGKPDDVPRND